MNIKKPDEVIYQFKVKTVNGNEISLEQYRGQVLLIVNVASRCGFTPQYKALEQLYEKYYSQGFNVLAFPCNQFGQQEPGSELDIQQFCKAKYQIKFPLFSKINVNGKDAEPLFHFLKQRARGTVATQWIKWNFTKFLIDKNGLLKRRFAPFTKPHQLEAYIKALLAETSIFST